MLITKRLRESLMKLDIVLVEPEIPQNTGNIARTCAATGANLHLVKPLGFSIDDRYLRRAGLDYWNEVFVRCYENFDELYNEYSRSAFYFATTKAARNYCDVNYKGRCFLVFGKETAGLPEDLLAKHSDNCIRIPMRDGIRSLNLSNSVAVVAYEALRQNGFDGMMLKGKFGTG